MAADKTLKGPREFERLLDSMKARGARGLIRPKDNEKLGIRFYFDPAVESDVEKSIPLCGISATGIERLQVGQKIHVEVMGQAVRTFFESQVLRILKDVFIVSLPKKLIRSDRRKKQRYICDDRNTPFIRPVDWHVNHENLAAPPIMKAYESMTNLIRVEDISFGGVYLNSRFPAFTNWIELNPFLEQAEVYLPMQEPFQVDMELRWSKRVRERIITDQGLELMVYNYKVGLKYIEPDMKFLNSLSEFLSVMKLTSKER